MPLPEEIHWSPGDSKLHDMSAEEVANQLVVFDWELFSCVHEVGQSIHTLVHMFQFSTAASPFSADIKKKKKSLHVPTRFLCLNRWSLCVMCSTERRPGGAPSTSSWYCSGAARCSTGSLPRSCSASHCLRGCSCCASSLRSQLCE